MLRVKNFGLAGGIVWGLGCFLSVALILITGYGQEFLNSMVAAFYSDYQINWWSSLVALVGGFIDGFIVFYFFALIYNRLNRVKKRSDGA